MSTWHSFSIEKIVQELDSNTEKGLSNTDALSRLNTYGLNTLDTYESVSWYKMLGRQFSSVLIFILLVAAGLSYFLGDIVDTLAILAIIVLNGLLGFAQEWKAEKALHSLKKMLSPHCRIIRDGKEQNIDLIKLVPGDLVLLSSGNIVPADIRLVESINLKADEASLTGESVPIDKTTEKLEENTPTAEQSCMVWMGTHIVNGHGHGLVTSTGMNTEFGRIAKLTGQIEETPTGLQKQLSVLGKQLGFIAIGVAALTVIIGWLWGTPLTQIFMAGVSLAVSAVPEGLPAVVTVTLALGIRVMARKKALLRNLQAAETLGATSVICTDKTGTLTQNEMTVQKIWLGSGLIDVEGAGYAPEGDFYREGQKIVPKEIEELKRLLETGSICNHAQIKKHDTQWMANGSPTEAAFITAALKADINRQYLGDVCAEFSFNSDRKRMSVITHKAGQLTSHIKGAPEVLLPLAKTILIDGKEHVIDDNMRTTIQNAYLSLAREGMRTLALARKTLPENALLDEENTEHELTLLGITGIIDPPRAEIKEAIRKTQNAGIKVIMITGDSPDTALAIAQQTGLPANKAITGTELRTLDEQTLLSLIQDHVVFARTVPEDKHRIVKLLQAQNHLVAMTGDGVNDAPALKQADIGIAMGIRGTDVAKGAADMVLIDDNFASIVSAIEEGRRQYANIRKFVRYLTSSNFGETLAVFLNILIGAPLILLPIQILWINLVTDSVTAFSLSAEKAEGNIMREPPRPSRQAILDKDSFLHLGLFGIYIAAATLILFEVYRPHDYAKANSIAFTALVIMANIHTLNFRSLKAPMHRIGFFSNIWLLIAITTMIGLQICAVYTPVLQKALNTAPLTINEWGLILVTALPLLILTEIYKSVRYNPNDCRA